MKIINIYMKDDFLQIWESYINTKLEGNANYPVGDEHNPGEPDNVDSSEVYKAMDKSYEQQSIAHKYEDMTDAQLSAHAEVIDILLDAGEEARVQYFNGEASLF